MGLAQCYDSAMAHPKRKPLRKYPAAPVTLQYLIYPYAGFHVGPLEEKPSFKIGPFDLWRDKEDNWQTFLGISRPSMRLAMYVDREGNPLNRMWIATFDRGASASIERWQHLTAVLFYLAWCRIPSASSDRPAGEDLYYEVFSVPEGGNADAAAHTRWSKYANTFWSALKIHPDPDVSLNGTFTTLPMVDAASPILGLDRESSDLFIALDSELQKPDSGVLTALWFLYQASFRSPSRSSFAEDIQNICTAFEALVNTSRRGDTANQVCGSLVRIFTSLALGETDAHAPVSGPSEKPAVLDALAKWVQRLYDVRNAYTHGKTRFDLVFNGRSIWTDAFEIFRMAANRVILDRTESKVLGASQLEQRLMSVDYFDATTNFFADKELWMPEGKRLGGGMISLDDAIQIGKSFDRSLIESTTSVKNLRQALFNMCRMVWISIEAASGSIDGEDRDELLRYFSDSYNASLRPKIDTDAFIRCIVPKMVMLSPDLPVPNTSRRLFELLEVLKNLAFVYGEATNPIVTRLLDML